MPLKRPPLLQVRSSVTYFPVFRRRGCSLRGLLDAKAAADRLAREVLKVGYESLRQVKSRFCALVGADLPLQ